LVIEWASESGIKIEQRDVSPSELWDAQELFLTSSTRDVLPITKLASLETNLELGNHRMVEVGPMTTKLAAIFRQQRTKNMNP